MDPRRGFELENFDGKARRVAKSKEKDTGNGGAGHGEVTIQVIDRPELGWATILPQLSEFRKQVELERLPELLDKTLEHWMKGMPGVRVKTTLGVVENGYTVKIHLWYEVVPQSYQ